jgi:hypothetical protein
MAAASNPKVYWIMTVALRLAAVRQALRLAAASILVLVSALAPGMARAQLQEDAMLLVAHPAFRDLEYRQTVLLAAPAPNGVGRRASAADDVEDEAAAVPAERDADSPYSSAAAIAEEEGESAAEGGGEADSASSAPAAAPAGPSSQRDTRWGDTSSYGAKKVLFSCFSPFPRPFLFSDTSEMPESFLRIIMLQIWSVCDFRIT